MAQNCCSRLFTNAFRKNSTRLSLLQYHYFPDGVKREESATAIEFSYESVQSEKPCTGEVEGKSTEFEGQVFPSETKKL